MGRKNKKITYENSTVPVVTVATTGWKARCIKDITTEELK